MQHNEALDLLMSSSEQMHIEGIPLMRRLLPAGEDVLLWEHYPEVDVVNGPVASRYFYHCHPVEERGEDEHGHFHIFLGKHAFPKHIRPLISAPDKRQTPKVVHLAALSISVDGLPVGWFTTNRWVTDEWLYSAKAILKILPQLDFRGAMGDPLVNGWLTAMVHLSANMIGELLEQRDQVLSLQRVGGENHDVEITSKAAINLAALLDG